MGSKRYSIQEKSILNFNYKLLYICKSKCDTDWHSTAHFHPFTEIFYITGGKGSFQLADTSLHVSRGDLIIINPNCLHTEKSTISDDPLEYIVLGIDNIVLNTFEPHKITLEETTNNSYKVINYGEDNQVLDYLNLLIEEIENKPYNYELACKSILTLFILYILRNTKKELKVEEEGNDSLNLECIKIKNYIDTNYSEHITLDYLANLSYLNKYHLVHTFTKQMGTSPINYLINKRIDEAKNLLSTTNFSIRDISTIVGFSNSSYFSHMFKKLQEYLLKNIRILIKSLCKHFLS